MSILEHLLFWACLVIVAIPMAAHLTPGERQFTPESFIYVGDSECGIPTAAFSATCRLLPWRPVILVTLSDTVFAWLDVLALAWLLLCALRSALAERFGPPGGFTMAGIVLSVVLAGVCLLDVAALHLAGAAMLDATLHMLLFSLTAGHPPDVRSIATALWFWVVLMPPLFVFIGRHLGKALGAEAVLPMQARTPAIKAAGAFVVLALVAAAFGAAAVVHGPEVSDLSTPRHDEMAVFALALALAASAGLLMRAVRWARGLAIALGIVSFGAGPIGVFVGAYVIWQLVVARDDAVAIADEASADADETPPRRGRHRA